MTLPGDAPHLLARWLRLCGLDLPDSADVLVQAAIADYRSRAELREALRDEPEAFRRWWYAQNYEDWHLTVATGGTDWAWLVLARAGAEVMNSRFGAL